MVVSKRKIVLDGFTLTETLHDTIEKSKVFGVTDKNLTVNACVSDDGCDNCTGCVNTEYNRCGSEQVCMYGASCACVNAGVYSQPSSDSGGQPNADGCLKGLNIKAPGTGGELNNGPHLGHDNITWLVEGDILCDGCFQCTGCNGCVGCYDCRSDVGCNTCQGCTGMCQVYVTCIDWYKHPCNHGGIVDCGSCDNNCTGCTDCVECNGANMTKCTPCVGKHNPEREVPPYIASIVCSPCYSCNAGVAGEETCGEHHGYDTPATVYITYSDGTEATRTYEGESCEETMTGTNNDKSTLKDFVSDLADQIKDETQFINIRGDGSIENLGTGEVETVYTQASPCGDAQGANNCRPCVGDISHCGVCQTACQSVCVGMLVAPCTCGHGNCASCAGEQGCGEGLTCEHGGNCTCIYLKYYNTPCTCNNGNCTSSCTNVTTTCYETCEHGGDCTCVHFGVNVGGACTCGNGNCTSCTECTSCANYTSSPPGTGQNVSGCGPSVC